MCGNNYTHTCVYSAETVRFVLVPKALLMNAVSKKVARSPLWAGQGEGAAGRAYGSRWRRRTVCVCVCVCSDCVSVGVGE